MKVGTDAMLLGALTYERGAQRILDIGTGTGVLALMMAQRHPEATINALEPEQGASEDAALNFGMSPYSHRLHTIQMRVQDYIPEEKYDLIICNPPYFGMQTYSPKRDPNPPDVARQSARLQNTLNLDELVHCFLRNISDSGLISVILPESEAESLLQKAMVVQLNCWGGRSIVSVAGGASVRRVIWLRKTVPEHAPQFETLTIRNVDGSYSEAYRQLTREYHGKEL